MKNRAKKIITALVALSMLAAVGCGYIEDVEPEKDGANLLESSAEQQDDGNENNDNDNDNDGDGENGSDDENGGDESADDNGTEEDSAEDSETESAADSEETSEDSSSEDGEGGDEEEGTASGEGDSYYNAEFGMTVPLPGVYKWVEYREQLVPDFEDALSLFRPLMETENVDDCVLSIFEYSSDSTLDDFTKAAWDRDYRNAGEGEDKYEVIDTQVLDFGGREGQLISEKLTSSNGEFYYGTIYISYSAGDYIKFRITCLTEDQLNDFCESIKGTTFD